MRRGAHRGAATAAALWLAAALGLGVALSGCASASADKPVTTAAAPDVPSADDTAAPTAPGDGAQPAPGADDEEEALPPDEVSALGDDNENDPLEGMNRYFFEINYALDETIFKAVAGWYRLALPQPAQDGIRNALRNLRSPVILANDLFQGELDRAGTTFARFLINSTAGLGGLFDVASTMGLKYHDEDFGQTLGSYGVGDYPYLMLPIFGPSNARDAVGRVVDMFLDPFRYLAPAYGLDDAMYVRAGLSGVDMRARSLETLDDLRRTSLDYYATIRSLYRQSRDAAVRNAEEGLEGPSVFMEEEPSPQAPADSGTEGEGAKSPAEMFNEDETSPAPAPAPGAGAEPAPAPA
ncbi:MAG: VacJ family lipoprotein, partial [Rhodospirillaceae bacterium]|nr:VacJ family lipoprotein [Rhodospirillaceae bacterium]